MGNPIAATVSLHRFRSEAALSVTGVGGETVYLDTKGIR